MDSIADLTAGKELIASGMTQEVERVRAALTSAAQGKVVSLVSSGDPGVYGMAGLALELAEALQIQVNIEIVPGMTAALAAAAALGAPLSADFAVVSLSDLLMPLAEIIRRLEAAAAGNFVTVLYNPKSTKRVEPLRRAIEVFLEYRKPDTICGVVTAAGTADEKIVATVLSDLPNCEIGMRSVIIIGNDRTVILGGRMVARRGYNL